MKKLVFAVLLAAVLNTWCPGGEYYVNSGGDDKSAGTSWETAFKTIQRAATDLKAGDTVTIGPGIYDEQVIIKAQGAADRPVTIRALRPGFTVIKASKRLAGFEPVAGMRFVSAAPAPSNIYNVVEVDTRRMLLRAPGAHDLDQFRNAYYYDPGEGRLYVHSSDGLPVSAHSIEVTTRHDYGMVLDKAKFVHIEGIVLQGHFIDQTKGHGFGMCLDGAQDCRVRDCAFLNNAGGATLIHGCQRCVVSGSLFIGNNDPLYGELAQLYVSGGADGCMAISNIVLDAPTHGIRFYSYAANSTAAGNIIKNARIGLFYKATKGTRAALNNVVAGCSYMNFNTGVNPGPFECRFNTFQGGTYNAGDLKQPDPTDLIFGDTSKLDPQFCDPDHLDYRLQADSPYRGKAPGGKDQGAYQFESNVFFVGPRGADANDGLSLARPFKTLKKACENAVAGATVYLLPGEYKETLAPAHSGTKEEPVIFRARGQGLQARVAVMPAGAAPGTAACELNGKDYIVIEDIAFQGSREGVRLKRCQGVRLNRCAVSAGGGAALEAMDTRDCDMRFCWLERRGEDAAGNPPAPAVLLSGKNERFSLTSSHIQNNGIEVLKVLPETPAAGLFLDYNNYAAPRAPAFAADGRIHSSLEAWQKSAGLDAHSISADPKIAADGRSVLPGSPLIGAGLWGWNIGPYTAAAESRQATIEDARVREATPTTCSITYWTPATSSALWRKTSGWWSGIPVLARVRYGVTPECADGVCESLGDVYHRDTLFDLKPGTKYYFKVELAREDATRRVNGQAATSDDENADDDEPDFQEGGLPPVAAAATEALEFTTPAEADWKPARRTFFVAPAGADGNDGLSKAKAFKTIAKACETVGAGDTVVVADGVYRETIAPACSGAPGAPITFRSETPNGAILDGSNFHRPSAVLLAHKGYVVIDGFVMRRFAPKNLGRRAGMEYAQATIWRSRHITVRNCVQFGYGNYGGAGVMMGAADIILSNNAIIGFSGAWKGRPLLGNSNERITLVNNTWYVPLIANLHIAASGFIMKNNLFYGVEEQKYSVGFISTFPRGPGVEVDYNAYGFMANDRRKRISSQQEKKAFYAQKYPEGEGLKVWQELYAFDPHGLQLAPEDVKFAAAPTVATSDPKFRQFWNPYREAQKAPTLALFDLPAGSPLNKAGENGAAIGARPVR